MRFSIAWLWLFLVFAACISCSEQHSSTAHQPATNSALSRPKPDSVAKTSSPPTSAVKLPTSTIDEQEVAAFLAGMPVTSQSALYPLTTEPAWQAFTLDAEKNWRKYHQTRTNRIERWAATELDSVRGASPTIFYPFSGPDLLNVVTVFPTSQTYVLVGLEPVGSVPERGALENPQLFSAIKASLWSVLNFSFFRTNDMAVDLKSVALDGSLPLLMLFAARTDHQIRSIRYIQLNTAGELSTADTAIVRRPSSKVIPGVELKLLDKQNQEKTIYYFSADLSDWKLGITKEAVLQYVRTLGPLTTYVKSATYLMHKAYFSKVRNLILQRSRYVLQDDSGIAIKYFRPAEWQLTYYGTYRRPINLFAKYYQPELITAYHGSLHRPRPLPFGTGYNWRQNDSNLLLARRRTAPAS